jgi:hypothetical protein
VTPGDWVNREPPQWDGPSVIDDDGPSGSARCGRVSPRRITNAFWGKAQAADRAGWRRPATCPGLATMWCTVPTSTCHPEWRCVRRPTLDAVIGAVTRTSKSNVGQHRIRCLLVIIGGHHLPCPTVPFEQASRGDGGDRWVAQIGVAGHRRVGHLRRSCGIGGPDDRPWVVVTPTRGGPGRGAGISESRSASSRSHRASSCCRRIHSASTIAAASSSRLVAHAVYVAISLTPFPGCCAPGPAVRWTVLGVDGLLVLAGDLDTARFGFLGNGDGQPQYPAAIAGLDRLGVEGLA